MGLIRTTLCATHSLLRTCHTHAGFLCVLEQASNMISNCNDVATILISVWELVVACLYWVLCANKAYPENIYELI